MAAEIPTNGTHITYQLQYRTCGKPTCGCHKDKGSQHGPYWYAYWREGSRLRSGYVGKVHPHMREESAPDGASINAVG